MRRSRHGIWVVRVGREDHCPHCGANDWEDRRPNVFRAVGRWLVFGRPMGWRERVCRNCGLEGGSYSYLVYGGGDRRWAVPLRLFEVLRRRRPMEPLPATYVGAAVVGFIVGLAARRALGWRWWTIPVASVAGTWLFFLSSALWGRRGSESLATEMLSVVAPKRGAARRRTEEEQRYRRVPFRLFGLDASWEGPRVAAGISGSWSGETGMGVEEVHLLHGDPDDPESPRLRVITRRVGPREEHRARHLAERLWQQEAGPPPAGLSPEEFARCVHERRREIEGRPDPAWTARSVPVDGQSVSFSCLEKGEGWVGMARIGDLVVELEAERLPAQSVSLVTSVDVEPYLEGQRMLDERRRRHSRR